MAQGYLALILHSHLPYVRHPEYTDCLEEEWLFQAVSECYAPLSAMLRRLERDDVPGSLAISFSPTLCEMLRDHLLRERCKRYIEDRRELTEKEVRRLAGTPYEDTARMYRQHYRMLCKDFVHDENLELLKGFAELEDAGRVELMTTAATHALLPLTSTPESRAAQVEIGCRNFHRHFGHRPSAIWLPECGYHPGLENAVADSSLKTFFVDSHAALLAQPRPRAGVFRPFETPSGAVACARDAASSRDVWSKDEGYPGHPAYREFYRDAGHDADYHYIEPHLHEDGVRRPVGMKYHRITGPAKALDQKEPYDPAAAAEQARQHARHFVRRRLAQMERIQPYCDAPPVAVAPYDTELFGHRWLEGLTFLETAFRTVAQHGDKLALTTPSRYLSDFPAVDRCQPGTSSWGFGGFFELWIEPSNDWIYPRLHEAEEQMVRLARQFPSASALQRRALDQCAREMLLAQASDWPFLMSVGSFEEYAAQRVRRHLKTFKTLHREIIQDTIDGEYLSRVEAQDNVFPEMDYRVFEGAPAEQRD